MKYFYELLESYSRLKKRELKFLIEAKKLDPEATSIATTAMNQASNQKPPPSFSKPYLSRPKNGNIIKLYYAGKVPELKFNTSNDTKFGKSVQKFWNEFVSLHSMDQSNPNDSGKGGSPSEVRFDKSMEYDRQEKLRQALIDQAKANGDPYAFFPEVGLMTPEDYQSLLSRNNCNSEKKKSKLCALLEDGYYRLQKTGQSGSVCKAIDQCKYVVLDCPEGEEFCKPKKVEGTDFELKKTMANAIKRVFDLLNKRELDISELDELRESVKISQSGQLMFIDPITKKGLVFIDKRGSMKSIIDAMTNGIKDEDGDDLDFVVDKYTFFGETKPSQASVLRGQYMEDLFIANSIIRNCHRKSSNNPEELQACNKKASKFMSKWKERKKEIREAFKGFMEELNSNDGLLAIDKDNPDYLLYAHIAEHVASEGMNEEDGAEFIIRSLQKLNATTLGSRNPDHIVPTGGNVGQGRKSDAMELYNNREDAIKALESEGFTREEAEFFIEPVTKDDICTTTDDNKIQEYCKSELADFQNGFAINISLKYYLNLNNGEGVKLGEIRNAVMSKLISDPEGYCNTPSLTRRTEAGRSSCLKFAQKQRETYAKHLGIDPSEFDEAKELQKEFDRHNEIFDNVPKINSYFDANGKLIKKKQFKDVLQTALESIGENCDVSDPAFITLRNRLKRSLVALSKKENISKEDILREVAVYTQHQKINNMLNSKDPKEKRRAAIYLATKGCYAGASSDKSVAIVRDMVNSKKVVASQNKCLSILKDLIDGKAEAKVSGKTIRITVPDGSGGRRGLVMVNNGETTEIHADTNTLEASRANKFVDDIKVQNITSDTKYFDNKLILKYLLEQKELMNKFIKTITKGV